MEEVLGRLYFQTIARLYCLKCQWVKHGLQKILLLFNQNDVHIFKVIIVRMNLQVVLFSKS